MSSDEDFFPPFQYGRTQPGSDTFRKQSVTSSSTNHNQAKANRLSQASPGPSQYQPGISQSQPGPSQSNSGPSQSRATNRSHTVISSSTNQAQVASNHRQMNPGTSQKEPSQEEKLSQLQDGLEFLMSRMQELTGKSGIKFLEKKPRIETPNIREPCRVCDKTYANKTTLFRHYRIMHPEVNPEKYYGLSLNSTVVNLDASTTEIQCSICGYIAQSQSGLDNHNRANHNAARVNINENVINNDGTVTHKDKMHKCVICDGFFEERSKFDEHMKAQHAGEVVCTICNQNLRFKDIDAHVKENHPDVYVKKNTVKNKENIVIEKVMKNKEGKRVPVFVCTQCDRRMYDKFEADKHSRGHKKRLKIKVAPRNIVPKSKGNFTDMTENNNLVIFTCDNCNISSGSYDTAVEHSQNHLTNVSYRDQCVTQTCPICEFTFEPLCYRKHMDLHYINKEIHKESFKHSKYKFQFLLTEKWLECFDMTDPIIKSVISASIYSHTRNLKMRGVGEDLGLHRLYKCCQCNNFVEPTAVLTHALNFDTCLKLKRCYACDICEGKFNNPLARDKHAKYHNSEIDFKIVLFNHDNDKEFNSILNVSELRSNNANNNAKVVYKCICGLCLISKETADIHKKICPGKDPKKPCPKCNYLFGREQLLEHCLEHHLNGTIIIIENITPDVIVIDSDEEIDGKDDAIAESSLSDAEEKIKNETDTITVQGSSEDEANDSLNACDIIAEAPVTGGEQTEQDNDMTDNDSQDTIAYENTEIPTNNPVSFIVSSCNEIKTVPINQLLSPFLLDKNFSERVDIGTIKQEITTDIAILRHDIESIAVSLKSELFNTNEQMSCWLNPTDFSKICRRPSLKQIEMSSAISAVESLLTDDEEEEMDAVIESENNYILLGDRNANAANNGPIVSNLRELFHEITATSQHNDINPTVRLTSIEESIDKGNMNIDHEHFAQVQTNPLPNKDTEVNINDISNDDLSSLANQNNNSSNTELNAEKVISSDTVTEQIEDQVLDSAGKETRLINNVTNTKDSESRRRDNNPTDETEAAGIGVIIENYFTLDADNTEGQKDKQNVFDHVPTQRDIIQTNNDDNTSDFVETDTNDFMVIDNVSRGSTSSPVDTTNIETKKNDYTDIEIKTELIAHIENDIKNGNNYYDVAKIKYEPVDELESESNLNEGNDSEQTDDDVKTCTIC